MPSSQIGQPNRILIVQTAFLGDVILATPILEKLHLHFPECKLDFLLRKGNEALFLNHPYLNEVFIWDKKQHKTASLFSTIKKIRSRNFDVVINVHRFASSGIVTVFSKGKWTIGFDKNPLSFLFRKAVTHEINTGKHEVERNLELIQDLTGDATFQLPKLYPDKDDYSTVLGYKSKPYICIAPSSVWFTKQLPKDKWTELITLLPAEINCYLLGAPQDFDLCEDIKKSSASPSVFNLAGQLSLLQSAALMQDSAMNYTNDSGPLHMASAMNAPITAVYCSTVPAFGFGPLSKEKNPIETAVPLACRPCGLHGYHACPEGHFKCANTISVQDLFNTLKKLPQPYA
jgi:ADP-heptose:LPS heptosyltransferase